MVFLPRFYFTLVVAMLLALASTGWGVAMDASLLLTLVLTGAVLIDVVLISLEPLRVQRKVPPILRQSQPFQVELALHNPSDKAGWFELVDSPPGEFAGEPPTIRVRLPKRETVTQSYTLKSHRRGRFTFGALFYRITGPLGLIQRQEKIELPQEVEVVPNLTGDGSRDLQLALAGAIQAGRRNATRRGEGNEFESLREHQRDDDFRHIDWKASAKRGKLITRQYETERDQRLMILLDTGRLMSPRIGDYRKLDYAINASVHLAQVALHKGDLVGYAIFNDELLAFAEPTERASAQMSRLRTKSYTRFRPTRLESDYAAVFHHVHAPLLAPHADRLFHRPRATRTPPTRCLQAALPLMPRHLPVDRHREQFGDSRPHPKKSPETRVRHLSPCRRDGNVGPITSAPCAPSAAAASPRSACPRRN